MLKTLNLLKFPLKTFTQKLSFQATLMELIQQEKERTETSKAVVRNKYNGRDKKRSWEEDSEQPQPKRERSSTDESFERIKRKKSAILIGYCGKDYFGMQRNPGMNTIEEVLLVTMLKHKWISKEGFDVPQQISFQRAARTDKGVSAKCQLISVKLPEVVDIVALNSDLPNDVRVFCVKRVTKGFNAKDQCDARTYTYTLPTAAFENSNVVRTEFRVSDDQINGVRSVLKLFEGTHNFHNFTARKHFHDPSSKRFIMSFGCEEPFLFKNVEFVTIKIKGQSFMLHQIRKMVGLALAVIRGLAGERVIQKAITNTAIDIPTAPGLGLMLDQVHYDRYNKRYGEDGIHSVLEWTEEEQNVKQFLEERIIPTILETEIEENRMLVWIENLSKHSYEERKDCEQSLSNESPKDKDIQETDVIAV